MAVSTRFLLGSLCGMLGPMRVSLILLISKFLQFFPKSMSMIITYLKKGSQCYACLNILPIKCCLLGAYSVLERIEIVVLDRNTASFR